MTTDTPTILIIGIKGGVGKTLVTNNISRGLAKTKKVGLIDLDIDSSNLPAVMGVEKTMKLNKSKKFVPVHVIQNKLKLFSMGLFTTEGPKAYARDGEQNRNLITHALDQTEWGPDLDLFILDQPAGSGDEFRTSVSIFKNIIGAIIVTQPTTSEDLYRCMSLTSRFFIPIIGVIQNMHGAICHCGKKLVCASCKKEYHPLGESPIEQICETEGLNYLGAIPMIPKLSETHIVKRPHNTPITKSIEATLKLLEA